MCFDPLGGGETAGKRSFWRRLAWFFGIWVASLIVLGIVSYLLRLWMMP